MSVYKIREHADDLFAGAGGWDLAAAKLGIHARGVEIMQEARATRARAALTTIHDDVWTFQPDGVARGLIASPPCQTFSQAGSGSGRRALGDVLTAIETGAYADIERLRDFGREVGDERTGLVLTPLHFATQHPYHWLAWEQVPTVLPVWEACAEVLRELGWRVWAGNVQAEQYGVPQTRKRALLLASLDHDVARPLPTHSRYHSRSPERLDEGVAQWVTMAAALRREFPAWRPTFNDQSGTPFDVNWPEKRPATVVAGRGLVQNPGATANRFNGSTKSRNDGVIVTVAEAATVQSFPADHPWQGNESKQYLQVGNAVPPLLARAALEVAAGLIDQPAPLVAAPVADELDPYQMSLFDDVEVAS